MKRIILGLLTLTVFAGYSQAITVNTNSSATTLVNTIFNGTATNITRSTGNGIGTFQNTNPAFPLSSGIVISAGNASGITTGVLNGTLSTTGSGLTDSDLQAFSNATGSTGTIQDASFLSFNFVATTSSLSMDYFFASEEYGTYQCGFSDKVAFLLTNLTTGVTTNIAVVPLTTTPVSVNTIRNNVYNTGCPSVNAQYFGAYDASNNSSLSGTCFNGRTVLLNASSNLVIGNTYKLKIVIGDYQDASFDSAIFMKSSLLDTNILGPDLTIVNNTAVCEGYTTTLSTGLSPSNYSFQWNLNGVINLGETGSFLVATLPGFYEVVYTNLTTTLVSSDSIIVEYNVAPVLIITNPTPVCSPQTVDITSPDVVFESDAEGTITYWLDASCTTPLVNPSSIAQSGTYYIKSSNSCGFDVEPVIVTILTTPTLTITNPAPVCFPETVNLTSPSVTIGSSGNGILTYWTNASCTIALANPTSVSVSGTYYIKSTIGGCSNVKPVVVIINQTPVISVPPNITMSETNYDGVAVFNLASQIPIILNGQSPNDFQIAFYASFNDALTEVNPLGNNYVNISNPQNIFMTVLRVISGCSITTSFSIEVVDSSLAVNDFDMKNVNISPNPIVDFMTISATENFNSIAIFNTLGQLVFEKKVNTSEEKIDLTTLTSGNYIIKINSETSSKVLKIIKK